MRWVSREPWNAQWWIQPVPAWVRFLPLLRKATAVRVASGAPTAQRQATFLGMVGEALAGAPGAGLRMGDCPCGHRSRSVSSPSKARERDAGCARAGTRSGAGEGRSPSSLPCGLIFRVLGRPPGCYQVSGTRSAPGVRPGASVPTTRTRHIVQRLRGGAEDSGWEVWLLVSPLWLSRLPSRSLSHALWDGDISCYLNRVNPMRINRGNVLQGYPASPWGPNPDTWGPSAPFSQLEGTV